MLPYDAGVLTRAVQRWVPAQGPKIHNEGLKSVRVRLALLWPGQKQSPVLLCMRNSFPVSPLSKVFGQLMRAQVCKTWEHRARPASRKVLPVTRH